MTKETLQRAQELAVQVATLNAWKGHVSSGLSVYAPNVNRPLPSTVRAVGVDAMIAEIDKQIALAEQEIANL